MRIYCTKWKQFRTDLSWLLAVCLYNWRAVVLRCLQALVSFSQPFLKYYLTIVCSVLCPDRYRWKPRFFIIFWYSFTCVFLSDVFLPLIIAINIYTVFPHFEDLTHKMRIDIQVFVIYWVLITCLMNRTL